MAKKQKLHSVWLARASSLADKVLAREDAYRGKSRDELKDEVNRLKSRVQEAKSEKKVLNEVLPDAYALACVAAQDVTGMDPYKVQIEGAIALHEGSIAELKTGEGKTLMVVMPALLHALTGKGVHVVTVNPYLTARDAKQIGDVLRYVGLTVGSVLPEMSQPMRKEAYACDVTYVSNTELGFDYLRDNMAVSPQMVVQRGLTYAIVDEVDSILIDDAKTPLIIAGQPRDVSTIYKAVDVVVSGLERGTESEPFNKAKVMLGLTRTETGDVIVHEKEKNTVLTKQGIAKIEKALGLTNYGDKKNRDIQHVVEQSLRAHYLMVRGKDYVVKDGKVAIVDEFTGRIMEGRSYSDGLHQAIEAKEHVKISPMNVTIATTTYQNFFRKYALLSGMTGTAATERLEFLDTYGLKVHVIPTNKPMIRIDDEDVLYLHKKDKYEAVVAEIQKAMKKGQPVLAGTASVEESEHLSDILDAHGIAHQTLNAVQDEHEADIIAKAGVHGTVTVATNMAGRGTDIILDDDAKKAGGLLVIGTEKHEAERIDNQLRGRSGRQGDPGRSIFYCSTEDRVMRLYGSDRFRKQLEGGVFDNGEPIPVKSVLRAIKTTQRHVELDDYAQRRDTLEYDDVNDMQREQIYAERRRILNGEDVTDDVFHAFDEFAQNAVEQSDNLDAMNEALSDYIGVDVKGELVKEKTRRGKVERLKQILSSELSRVKEEHGDGAMSFLRRCLLTAIDSAWAEQLKGLDYLRDAVSYVGYGQRDPKAVYAHEAYDLYGRMQAVIYAMTVMLVFRPMETGKKTEVDGVRAVKKEGMHV